MEVIFIVSSDFSENPSAVWSIYPEVHFKKSVEIMRLSALLPFFSSALADCKGDSDYRVAHNWYEQSNDGKNQKFESFLTLHLPDHDIDSWDITVHFKVLYISNDTFVSRSAPDTFR